MYAEDLNFDQIPQLQPTKELVRNERTFVFEDKQNAALISLDDLRHTRTLRDAKKKLPASRPIEHTEFIDLINEVSDKKGIQVLTPEIYVSKSDSHYDTRTAAALGLPNTLEAWFFDRLICRIPLVAPDDSDFNPAIAIGYNAKGITLAFGTNVRICSNMSIFGGKLLKTYDEGVPFNRMIELFVAWMGEMQRHYEYDLGILQRMKNTYLSDTRNEIERMSGKLHLAASRKNRNIKLLAPLDQTQANAFDNNLIALEMEGKINLDTPDLINIYDLYNIGTNILTHSQTNLEYKWSKIADMGEFIEQEYLN